MLNHGLVLGVTFDWTINLGQLLTVGGGILAFLKVFLGMQKLLDNHELRLKTVEGEFKIVEVDVKKHDTWLVRAGLDLRHGPTDRRE